jgi:hypothetical protein
MSFSPFDLHANLSVAHQAGIPRSYFVYDLPRTRLYEVQTYVDPSHVPNVVDYDGAPLDGYQWRVSCFGGVRASTSRRVGGSTEILFKVVGEGAEFSAHGWITNFYVVQNEIADWDAFVAALQRAGLT